LGASATLGGSGAGSSFFTSTTGFAAASSLTTCFFAQPVAMKAMATTEIRTTNQIDDFFNIPFSSFFLIFFQKMKSWIDFFFFPFIP
jgi:hypothetical protein